MMKRKKIGMLFCLGLLLAITGTATVRSLAVQARVYTAPLVVIDPGHGGFDPGAIGMDTKVEECEINLAIAKLLKAELEQRGYRVLMTREEDKALAHTKKADMQARRDMIGQSGADLVLSIHQNSNPDRSANGAMVLYYKESEEGQRIAQAVQERLNGALKSEKRRDADSHRGVRVSFQQPGGRHFAQRRGPAGLGLGHCRGRLPNAAHRRDNTIRRSH